MVVIVIAAVVTLFLIIGCIKSKKTFMKACLGIVALINALLTCLIAGFVFIIQYKITDVDSRKSQDGRYELLLQEVGEPDWPFGYTHVRLLLKNGEKTITTYRFDVANDGCRMSSEQWMVDWNNDGAEVIIYGDEQMDFMVFLGYNGDKESRQLDTKYGKTEEEYLENIEGSNGVSFGETESTDYSGNKEPEMNHDGYPLSDEWQGYKNEMEKIAQEIKEDTSFEIEYHLTSKGYPYVVISRKMDEPSGNITEQRLVMNEAYNSTIYHEYVLEEYCFSQEGTEILPPKIIDFYLIDCKSYVITDEQTDQWH